MHSLCIHKPFFLPSLACRAKFEPVDPGCWRKVKAGKVSWTVLVINRKDIFKQKKFSQLPRKETKGFSKMNPGSNCSSYSLTFMSLGQQVSSWKWLFSCRHHCMGTSPQNDKTALVLNLRQCSPSNGGDFQKQ